MIQVKLSGRLGNQMFQYAILRIVAKENGYEFNFPREWRGKNYFHINYGKKQTNEQVNKIFQEGVNSYNSKVFSIQDNTVLHGYWQSPKYLKRNEEYVRDLFKLKDKSLSVENLNREEETCLIHFRGGDYFSHNYVPSKKWYDAARSYMSKINNRLNFKVITDDPKAAIMFFPNDKIISKTEIDDFCSLYRAKYKILSASTFSWWAHWLSNKKDNISIAPDNWINHNGAKGIKGFYPIDVKTESINYI